MRGVRSQSNFPRIASRFFMPLKIGDCSDDCRNSIGKNVRVLRAGLGKKRRMPFQPFPASGKQAPADGGGRFAGKADCNESGVRIGEYLPPESRSAGDARSHSNGNGWPNRRGYGKERDDAMNGDWAPFAVAFLVAGAHGGRLGGRHVIR
ncbi:hypothetical protein [Burkholderia ubonensis]|uniref:hypothetical protein n=1 Tax=Burkholderia ubonensis TaxID=101571 RepID=UPI0002DD7AB3|nr:hypothetical protein [Burkholderia ubonensis]